MSENKIDDGGPAFPCEVGPSAMPLQVGNERWILPGMSLRDYFAVHSTQPGCSEICAFKGFRYVGGSVWSDEVTRIDGFNNWWESLPIEERLDLCSRVRYAQADSMLKARQS